MKPCQKKRLLINANDISKAQTVIAGMGFSVEINHDSLLEIRNEDAIGKPDTIATILVNAGCPPTLLKVEEEDLETYFLRTIGLKGGER